MKELIRKLKESEVTLSVDGDELVVSFDGDHLPEKLIDELRSNKAKLIEFLKKYDQQEQFVEIQPVPKSDGYPLSSGQQRLWVLCQMEDASLAYHMPTTIELAGLYQFDLLEKAIHATIVRHEILRTVFRETQGGAVKQYVLDADEFNFKIDHLDFSNFSNPEIELEKFLQNDAQKLFDLQNGPLIRACLIKKGEGKYTFYYNMHHIIGDGWSLDVLGEDVMKCYQIFSEDREIDIPPLRIQYKDYSAWQLDQLKDIDNNKHKTFWNEKFKDIPTPIDLPVFKRRPKLMTHNGHILETYISAQDTERIRTYSEQNGGSLFIGLLTVWNALFYRYTGQKDIVIGTPVAGRDHVELENQIGFYLNLLPLRNQLNPEEGMNQVFQEVKKNTLQAYSHQSYPFDKLVDDLKLKRDTSRSALFDVMLVLQNTGNRDRSDSSEGAIAEGVIDRGEAGAKYDLRIIFEESGGCLCMNVNFNKDVYEKRVIENLMQHFVRLMKGMLDNPNQKIGAIEYLLPEEKQFLIQELNQTEHSYSKEKNLVTLFEESVNKNPDNIAIIDSIGEMTYSELNLKANQLANVLVELGIGKGDYVCLHMSRERELLESVIGTVKSGAAYVPFEPDLPIERKLSILNDLKVKIIVTDKDHLQSVIELSDGVNSLTNIICLSEVTDHSLPLILDRSVLNEAPSENLNVSISPKDEAYIIFTSGSTGKPKGVVVEHQPVINLLQWVNSKYKVTSQDKLLMVASISFDLSVYDIFGILTAGGTVRIASHAELGDPSRLVEIIYSEGITFWDSAPAALVQLTPELLYQNQQGKEGALRLVFLSGDWIPLTIQPDLKTCFENVQVVGLGGATEAVIWSNHYLIEGIDSDWQSIPYGKPIWNAKYYVLDSEKYPCPVGVEGDLYIGGEVLAKEYKNDEDLSSKKFIDDPYNPGGTMYYTGDRARFFNDGNIEFRGRLDDQVKIRGYRIELGDVRHAIEQHDAIKDAFVTTKGVKTDRQLMAYYTVYSPVAKNEIRAFIASKLPDYMVPTFMMELDSFPVTVNGKLDRSALPEIELETSGETFVAAESELEKKLVQIWGDVLKLEVDKIGVTCNFFELGGDSLRATMVISKVLNELNYKLDLRELFVDPTIRCIAQQIEADMLIAEQDNRLVDDQNELVF